MGNHGFALECSLHVPPPNDTKRYGDEVRGISWRKRTLQTFSRPIVEKMSSGRNLLELYFFSRCNSRYNCNFWEKGLRSTQVWSSELKVNFIFLYRESLVSGFVSTREKPGMKFSIDTCRDALDASIDF